MDLVKRLIAALIVLNFGVTLGSSPAAEQSHPKTSTKVNTLLDFWQPLLLEASKRFDVPAAWLRAVMRAESGGHALTEGLPTTSVAGAMGLMQIMPATWTELSDRYSLGNDPYQPRANILAGAAYLREQFERYGWPLCLAAYHAGPARVDAFLNGQQVLPEATRKYVAFVQGMVTGSTTQSVDDRAVAATGKTVVASAESLLFFRVGDHHTQSEEPSTQASERRLFVPLLRDRARVNDGRDNNPSVSKGLSRVQSQ